MVLLLETVLPYPFCRVGESVLVEGLQVLLLAVGALEGGDTSVGVVELGLEFGSGGLRRYVISGCSC